MGLDITSNSAEETIELGHKIGSQLKGGEIIGLCGELGSGKTHLIKGIAAGAGAGDSRQVNSPTFVIVNEYSGRVDIYHIDAYRLETVFDFLDAGLDEYLHGNGVVVMEWADRWPEILPESNLTVRLVVLDEHSREITLSGCHPDAVRILRQIKVEVG